MNLQRRPRFYGYAALAVCHVGGVLIALAHGRLGAAVALLDIGCLWMAAAYAAEESP